MITTPVPTSIITGFLGVGKTTLIKQLLAHKPEGEVWAVLVNEFGEVGIDAQFLHSTDAGIQIKEVAGGCMCCAAGLPTQVAINQLLARAKPDRLLIEPTGLGHPNEIIKLLSASHYQHVISLRSSICLVDARKVTVPRYRDNANFIQQLQVADVVVATKYDTYGDQASELLQALRALLVQIDCPHTPLLLSHDNNSAALDETNSTVSHHNAVPRALWTWLDSPSAWRANNVEMRMSPLKQPQASTSLLRRDTALSGLGVFANEAPPLAFDANGIVRKHNQGEGCYSCGWVMEPIQEFDFDRLLAFIEHQVAAQNGQALLRLKAVMITSDGIAAFNWIDGELSIQELDDALDSRLEIIALSELDWPQIEQQLLVCRQA